MSETLILEIGRQALQVALLVSIPMLATSLVVGILISLIQVATSLQDATLSFAPKILAVGVVLLFAGQWIITILVDFMHDLLTQFPDMLA